MLSGFFGPSTRDSELWFGTLSYVQSTFGRFVRLSIFSGTRSTNVVTEREPTIHGQLQRMGNEIGIARITNGAGSKIVATRARMRSRSLDTISIVLLCCCKVTTGDEWVCVTKPGWSSCALPG